MGVKRRDRLHLNVIRVALHGKKRSRCGSSGRPPANGALRRFCLAVFHERRLLNVEITDAEADHGELPQASRECANRCQCTCAA